MLVGGEMACLAALPGRARPVPSRTRFTPKLHLLCSAPLPSAFCFVPSLYPTFPPPVFSLSLHPPFLLQPHLLVPHVQKPELR